MSETWTCYRDNRGCDHESKPELARIMEYGLCHEDVTREGYSQPCEKTAVAVRIDTEDGGPYPVCAFHARGEMVPLQALLAVCSK